MKRLVLGLAALAAVAAPLAIATSAEAQGRNDRREWRDDRGRYDNRWDNRRGRGPDRFDNRGRGRGPDGFGPPGQRRDFRWDDRRYNGYYLGNRWNWGPPPVVYYNRYDFRPAYRPWQRGMVLPPVYRNYVIYDYGRYRLRPPPRGYHWVRHNDDYLLVAIATGIILDVIVNR